LLYFLGKNDNPRLINKKSWGYKGATKNILWLNMKYLINFVFMYVFRYFIIVCSVFFINKDGACQSSFRLDSIEKTLKNVSNKERLDVLNNISDLYYKEENYAKAIKYKIEEQKQYTKEKNDSMVAFCNEKLGVMYYHIGNYNLASDYLMKALLYFEDHNNKRMEGQIATNLANVFTRLENHKKAIDFLRHAEKIFIDSSSFNKKTLSALYTNLGLAYNGFNKPDSAMYYYNKALKLINKEESPLYVASITNNIGEVEFERGKYNEALAYYTEALQLFSIIENQNGMGAAKSNIAKIKIETKKYKEAITLSYEALDHFKKINALFFIVSTHKQLYKAYKGQGEYEKALLTLELVQKDNDSLMGVKTTEYIANLEMQYTIQKEQQKFKLLEQESQLIEKELKLKQIYLYVTIGGVLFLLITTILVLINLRGSLQRNKLKQDLLSQEQEKLRDSLFFKQKEIENFANYIQEKNKLLSDLKNEIHALTKSPSNNFNDLKNLTQIVTQSLHVDNDRKELELKLDQIHQEFINRLKNIFPKLTKTETRLCSLLLLELSSKEIAGIMNIEYASVKTSRNRLRKKLNLTTQADIGEFLNKI